MGRGRGESRGRCAVKSHRALDGTGGSWKDGGQPETGLESHRGDGEFVCHRWKKTHQDSE